jgi:CRP-like cAMP-binding protein
MSASEGFLDVLAPEGRVALEKQWVARQYERGEVIIGHEERDRDVYFVLGGRARATIYSDGGKMVAYRDIEAGGIFGELAAIDGSARSASVIALEPLRVARLSAAAFRELVETRPDFAWALLAHLSRQVRRMTERIYEFSTLVVRKRLIRELLRLAGNQHRGDEPASIFPAPTHFDLATMISTHREAVSREMSELAKRHLVERRGRRLMLPDPAALEALAGGEQ